MAPINQALLFAINNTTNRYEAAALADRLGGDVVEAKPKVSFPPDWVLEYAKGPVARAVFAVTYCNDPGTLSEISASERRITVLGALAKNLYLPRVFYEAMLTRVTDGQRRDLETARIGAEDLVKTPRDRIAELLEDPTMFQFGRHGRATSVSGFLNTLREYASTDPKAIDQVLLAEANNGHQLVSAFLQNYYASASSYDDVWECVTLSPRHVLDLYSEETRTTVLYDLVRTCTRQSTQRRPIDVDVAELLLTLSAPATYVNGRESLRHLFTPEAISLLVVSVEWAPLLVLQYVDDAQFATLLSTLPPSPDTKLLYPIDNDRARLELVLDALLGSLGPARPILTARDLDRVMGCFDDPDDVLITKLLTISDADIAFSYVSGNYNITGPNEERIRVLPRKELVANIVKDYPEISDKWRRLATPVKENRYPLEYTHTLLDLIPGLYFTLLNEPAFTGYFYERLGATGADSTQIVEQLEVSSGLTFSDLCETLQHL